jgi:hypothetical protein
MRAAAGALLAVVVLALAGCGSEGTPGGGEAAQLVPPDALAFMSVDGTDREGWQTVRALTGGPTVGMGKSHYALLDLGTGEPTVIILAGAGEDLPAPVGRPRRRIRIEKIGDWSVAAEPAALAAVRAAQSGRSLADVERFQRAMAEIEGDALLTAYANGARLQELPGELGALFRVSGMDGWITARLFSGDGDVQVHVRADTATPVYGSRLLREVPSGALLAISFRDADQLLRRLAAELDEYRPLLADLLPAVRGEGVIYATQGALLPTIVLEVESPNPDEAAGALRRLAGRLKAETNGLLSFKVATRGTRALLTNGAGWPATPTERLVDDQTFKDALAAADAPEEVSWLAYADMQRLTPIVQALAQLVGGSPLSEEQKGRLDRLRTVVAYRAQSQLTLRLTGR